MLVLYILIFSVLVWLGLYSLSRDAGSNLLRISAIAQLILTAIVAIVTILDPPVIYGVLAFLAAVIAIPAGVSAIVQDARLKREPLIPETARAFDYAMIVAVIFGGQVVIVMLISTGASTAMVALLLTVITTAIAIQVFLNQVQSLLDGIAMAGFPALRRERAELREFASALPKVDDGVVPLGFGEEEFVRHTRRALTNFGDLTKLTLSPLIQLPLVTARLAMRGAEPTTLERAAELKELLAESIEQLRPRGDERFGTAEEWRYYNSLYFPYVIGIKPYSRRVKLASDNPDAQQALDWFRTYVPERTFHNWQNAGARLVARHLREQSQLQVEPEINRLVVPVRTG